MRKRATTAPSAPRRVTEAVGRSRVRRLVEDWKTVREIARRKQLVRHHLLTSATHCHAGNWRIEGPYARHLDAPLPDGLRDAIRGIRQRARIRELVERISPPWHVRVPAGAGERHAQCRIAYLSNGGNWKLFDFDNHQVWSRPMFAGKSASDVATLESFGRYFDIPPWRVVREGHTSWRVDRLIPGMSMVHAAAGERRAAVRHLLDQYAAFAREEALPASPALTDQALATIVECAPHSVPAAMARSCEAEMKTLGRVLKLVPAHDDLSAQNVIVRDGRVWVLDWDTAGTPRPVLYDILYLVLREATLGRTDLLDAFVAGEFDDRIERNFAAFRLAQRPPDNMVLLMHGYIVHFHAARLAGRLDARAANVDSVWNALRPYCETHLG